MRRRSAFVFTLLIVAIFAFDALFPADLSPRPHTRVVVDRHGAPLRHFADAGVWRYRTDPVHVSSRYLEALLTFEDRWFYEHPGVNPLALARATLQWMRSGHIVSGGSTLTMQVARIRYPGHRGWWGKLVQIVRALQLEAHHTKAEILTYYLNHAPFGGPLEGVEVASRAYFGYPAAQLTWSQAALLAGLPQAPSRFRPDRYAERARTQRDKVLERLHTAGVLSAAEVQSAKLEEVEAYAPDSPLLSPLLARRLIRHTPNAATVSTFIDSEIQRALESNVREHKSLLPAGASVALLAMEHGSGEVVAYVGSVDFTDATRFGHVDMVTARRSPGSTLKPFIYALAMDRGILHSGSLLMDVPLNFGDYRPVNFNRGFSGPVSVTTALQKSLNIPAVQVLEQLNPDHFYAAIQTAGADLHLLPGAKPNLAIALGGVSTSLEHLVTLYSALGNGGETLRPRLTPRRTVDQASAAHPRFRLDRPADPANQSGHPVQPATPGDQNRYELRIQGQLGSGRRSIAHARRLDRSPGQCGDDRPHRLRFCRATTARRRTPSADNVASGASAAVFGEDAFRLLARRRRNNGPVRSAQRCMDHRRSITRDADGHGGRNAALSAALYNVLSSR